MVKKRVVPIRAAQTPVGRVIDALSLVLVMAGSKFLVLEFDCPGVRRFRPTRRVLLGDGSDPDPDAGSAGMRYLLREPTKRSPAEPPAGPQRLA